MSFLVDFALTHLTTKKTFWCFSFFSLLVSVPFTCTTSTGQIKEMACACCFYRFVMRMREKKSTNKENINSNSNQIDLNAPLFTIFPLCLSSWLLCKLQFSSWICVDVFKVSWSIYCVKMELLFFLFLFVSVFAAMPEAKHSEIDTDLVENVLVVFQATHSKRFAIFST